MLLYGLDARAAGVDVKGGGLSGAGGAPEPEPETAAVFGGAELAVVAAAVDVEPATEGAVAAATVPLSQGLGGDTMDVGERQQSTGR